MWRPILAHELAVSVVRGLADLEAVRPEWAELFKRAALTNPFGHPIWLIACARAFLHSSQLRVLLIREANGTLVGVAPFYCQARFVGRVRIVARLCLL